MVKGKEQNFGFSAELSVIGGPRNEIANRQKIGEKSEKSPKYFTEISRLYLIRACAEISEKNIGNDYFDSKKFYKYP